jgi:hypothetical protein
MINDALENLINDRINDIIYASNVICIFGMSIGATDSLWWRIIGNWLRSDQFHDLLIFFKRDDFDKIHPENKIATINYVKDVFLKYIENQKDINRDRIHVCYETDVFNLNLAE